MSPTAGALRLLRLAWRRDRIRIPIWIVGLSALLAAQAAGNADTYPTEDARRSAATVLAANPALRMLRGAAADTSVGALLVSDTFWITATLTALVSVFTVVRHTRHDEETGRGELIGAAPVGSHAMLTAALVLGATLNVVLAGALALVLIVGGLPMAGAFAFGAAVGATGLVFVGTAAITSQLSPSGRGANALAVAAIGAAYLLRGVGDALGDVDDSGVTVAAAWPSWLSPMGWAQRVEAFADDNWWPLGLSLLAFLAASASAMLLLSQRDYGQGLFPQRPGRAGATDGLLRPLGMAWRMQRGSLIGWAAGMLVLGGVFGSVGTQVDDLANNEAFVDLLARLGASSDALSDTYFAAAMNLVGVIAACYPLQAVLRLQAEESDGRLEPVLATALGRVRWLVPHAVVTAGSVAVLLVLAGGAAGFLSGDVPGRAWSLTVAALVQAPAVLALTGLAVAAFGALPRVSTAVTWTAFAIALLLGPLGDSLGVPDALRDASPFTHTPAAPAVDVSAGPVLWLVFVALALTAAGAAAFTHRDLALRA